MLQMRTCWRTGDESRAICEHCARVVIARFEQRTYALREPRIDAPNVLVAVCTVCDGIVAVPLQSSALLNAARKAARSGQAHAGAGPQADRSSSDHSNHPGPAGAP